MGKNKNIKNSSKSRGYYLPILFIIVIVPLISHGKIVELPQEEANFWKGGTIHLDFFNYYKSIAFVISTLALVLAYGGLFLNNKLPLQKEKRYYFPMLIYLATSLASTIFAYNRHVAVAGFIEMYQGILVLISYVTVLFIMINYVRDEKDLRVISNSFLLLIVIEGLLGLSQYFGFDFFKTQLGPWVLSPSILRGQELGFAFGKYTIYGTLYNTNFVGSFGALVLPLSLVLFLEEKDLKKSVVLLMAAFLAFASWLGCNSRAGYFGIAVSFLLGIIIFRKTIKKFYKKHLILFAIFIVTASVFNTVSSGRVSKQFLRLNPLAEVEKIQDINEGQPIRFREVAIEDNTFTVRTDKETLVGLMQDSVLSFEDGNGSKLAINIDKEGKITFSDEKYSGYSFTSYEDEPSYIEASLYGRSWQLYIAEDQVFQVISINNKLAEPIEAPRIKWFDGKETFASNRGYIWSRSIPLLKDALIIGYGPDNYPMVFPQEDYVGRFNVGDKGMLDIIIDKPHNMYLQTAINTGVISLIALLVIWGIYLFDSLKLYIKGNMKSFTDYMGAATFLSITGYLAAGIFNDSVLSVAPLFWILLGMGIGINNMVRTKK